ncbi:hypothetical protein [Nocardia australiensis]|uniref:hypothetical protein n=1 Tax=Nocardia australiensis TaxID=2887191 RepID=UPI001D14E56E|nr:hypothetical protein [Nocardia australiensis]
MSAPSVSEDVMHRLHYYRTVGGLPAHVDERGRIAVRIGGNVRAFVMVEYWGYRVRDELGELCLHGPMIWHPVRRLTMLTRAYPDEDRTRAFEEIVRQTDSVLVEPGHSIVLPTPGDSGRGWITPVRDMFRPSMVTALAALTECVSRGCR